MIPTSVSASSSAESAAQTGSIGDNATGDFIVDSPGAKSGLLSGNLPLILIALAVGGFLLWRAQKK